MLAKVALPQKISANQKYFRKNLLKIGTTQVYCAVPIVYLPILKHFSLIL